MEADFPEKYRAFLKRYLPAAKDASGLSEIVCRCQYCPDSRDPTHGHMYISIPQSQDDISWFYCQKCHTTGLVNSRTLIEWGIYDPEIGTGLNGIHREAEARGKTNGFTRKVYPFSNHISDTRLALRKMEYINQRLGTNITLQQAMADKVVFNLGEILRFNNIQEFTRHPNIIQQLNDQFVGFLSFDNNFVNLRRTCEEGIVYENIDKRYVNYNIHNKRDNTEKFYTSPCQFDMRNPISIPVHIAEGPFDILSIKYNLRKSSGVYSAITGSAYKGMVKHLINSNKMYYIDLHIYPDNDKSGDIKMIQDLVEFIRPYGIPLSVHRNTFHGEKDFGVPLSKIREVVEKII